MINTVWSLGDQVDPAVKLQFLLRGWEVLRITSLVENFYWAFAGKYRKQTTCLLFCVRLWPPALAQAAGFGMSLQWAARYVLHPTENWPLNQEPRHFIHSPTWPPTTNSQQVQQHRIKITPNARCSTIFMFSWGKPLLNPLKVSFCMRVLPVLHHIELYILSNRSKSITDEKALEVIFGYDSGIERWPKSWF